MTDPLNLAGCLAIVLALGALTGVILLFLRERASEWDEKKAKLFQKASDCQSVLEMEIAALGTANHGPVYQPYYERARETLATARAKLENISTHASPDRVADLKIPRSQVWKVLPVLQEIRARLAWQRRTKGFGRTLGEVEQEIAQVHSLQMEISQLGQKTRVRAHAARQHAQRLQERGETSKLAAATLAKPKEQLSVGLALLDEVDQALADGTPTESQVERAAPLLENAEELLKTITSELDQTITLKEQAEKALTLAETRLGEFKEKMGSEERQQRPFKKLAQQRQNWEQTQLEIRQAFASGIYGQAKTRAQALADEIAKNHAELDKICIARQRVQQDLDTCEFEHKRLRQELERLPPHHQADLCIAIRDATSLLVQQLRALLISEELSDLKQASNLGKSINEKNVLLAQKLKSFRERASQCDNQWQQLDKEIAPTLSKAQSFATSLRGANARYRSRVAVADLDAATQTLHKEWEQTKATHAVLLESTIQKTQARFSGIHNAHIRLVRHCNTAETILAQRKQDKSRAQEAIKNLRAECRALETIAKDSSPVATRLQAATQELEALEKRCGDEREDYAIIGKEADACYKQLDREEQTYRSQLERTKRECTGARGQIIALRQRLDKLATDRRFDFGEAVKVEGNELQTWLNKVPLTAPSTLNESIRILGESKTLQARIVPLVETLEKDREQLMERTEKLEAQAKEALELEHKMEDTLRSCAAWNSANWKNLEKMDAQAYLKRLRDRQATVRQPRLRVPLVTFELELNQLEKEVIETLDFVRKGAKFASDWAIALRKENDALQHAYEQTGTDVRNRGQSLRDPWNVVVRRVKECQARAGQALSPQTAAEELATAHRAIDDFRKANPSLH